MSLASHWSIINIARHAEQANMLTPDGRFSSLWLRNSIALLSRRRDAHARTPAMARYFTRDLRNIADYVTRCPSATCHDGISSTPRARFVQILDLWACQRSAIWYHQTASAPDAVLYHGAWVILAVKAASNASSKLVTGWNARRHFGSRHFGYPALPLIATFISSGIEFPRYARL